jgi:hypothetical protein
MKMSKRIFTYLVGISLMLFSSCGESITDTNHQWIGIWKCTTTAAEYQLEIGVDDYATYTVISTSKNVESKIIQGKARLKDGYINIKMESLRVYQSPEWLNLQQLWTVIIEGRQFIKH